MEGMPRVAPRPNEQGGVRPGARDPEQESFSRVVALCAAWFQKTGRLPDRASSNGIERQLGSWFLGVQRADAEGRLREAERADLNNLIQHALESRRAFLRRLEACSAWVAANGRLPHRNALDTAETDHFTWLANRRVDRSLGRLPLEWERGMELLLPGWNRLDSRASRPS